MQADISLTANADVVQVVIMFLTIIIKIMISARLSNYCTKNSTQNGDFLKPMNLVVMSKSVREGVNEKKRFLSGIARIT